VGSGIVPVGPPELVDTWRKTIDAACPADVYDPALTAWLETEQNTESRKRAGRKGSVTTARQLVALASSLTKEGEVITAQDIATTLGVSFDEARHLIALVTMGSGESIDYLPLIMSDQADEVSLMEGAMLSARSIRLTRSETIALRAALTELGVDESDPLFQTLSKAYAAPTFTEEDVVRSFELPSSSSDTSVLKQCSKAISAGMGLTFSYLPVTGGPASERKVVPQVIRRSDDSWYLDAFDLMRLGPRVFRIDRMSDLEETPVTMPPAATQVPASAERMVVIRFSDQRYLDVFPWDEIQKLTTDEQGTVVRMPLYGGTWLARHLVACAGTVRVSDRELAAQMRSYDQMLKEKVRTRS
jgi:proteasome accessory factor C